MLSPHDVAAGLGELLLNPVHGLSSAPFRSVAIDSRAVAPGGLFVALPGEHTDGHRFIADALRNGAAGVLATGWPGDVPGDLRRNAVLFPVAQPADALQRLAAYWRSRFAVRTIAVTGSVGKTSTKEAIAHLLGGRYRVLKSTGNLNTEIGMPLVLLQLTGEHQRLVVEMGMHRLGDIALLCRLAQPTVGVVTNVGPTHMERLGSIERIAGAKAELPASLGAGGIAVLNADDPRVLAMAARTGAQVVTYGLARDAGVRASDVCSRGLDGLSFTLHWQEEQRQVRTPLIGRHNVYTALAAAAVGLTDGMDMDAVGDGLARLPDSERVKVRHTRNGALVLDDTYNASPASMIAALDLLASVPGERVAVLADMLELGAAEIEGHRQVGEHAARSAQAVYAIGERARTIANAAAAAGLANTRHYATKDAALAALRAIDRPGVVLLFKGSRGMALDELAGALCQD